MSWLLASPILLPIATAIVAFLLRRRAVAGAWVSVAGQALNLLAAATLMTVTWRRGVVAAQIGDWPSPFGITLVTDLLGAVMVLITAVTGLAVAVYAVADIDARRARLGYHALFQILIAGVGGAFLTGDLFNLYVWFEVMLIASFGLLVLGGGKRQIDAGIKYVVLNLVSTALFLAGIGMVYALTGTLNMALLHLRIHELQATSPAALTAVATLFMIAFGVKAALFPLFFWLPASYHTPPVAVSAVFAGLLTKVGVYALIRAFTLLFTHDVAHTHTVLLAAALLTMVTGVLGAAAQNELRQILSFHIISQIGYMVLGLALYTPLALVGAVFYLVHHIIVKANLFLLSGVARRLTGSFELDRIGGLYRSSPLLAALFLVPAFSLAGFPPLSGFWAKFLLVKASLDGGHYAVAATALAVGLLTVYSMTKIWGEAFWKDHPEGRRPTLGDLDPGARRALLLPIATLALMTVGIGLFPQPFLTFAERAAGQLLEPATYVEAVLGGPR